MCDKVQVKSNLTGGNSTMTFHTGEYQLEELAKLLLVPQECEIKVTAEWSK